MVCMQGTNRFIASQLQRVPLSIYLLMNIIKCVVHFILLTSSLLVKYLTSNINRHVWKDTCNLLLL